MTAMWRDDAELEELARARRAEMEMKKQTCENRLGTGLASTFCPNCEMGKKGKCFHPEKAFLNN